MRDAGSQRVVARASAPDHEGKGRRCARILATAGGRGAARPMAVARRRRPAVTERRTRRGRPPVRRPHGRSGRGRRAALPLQRHAPVDHRVPHRRPLHRARPAASRRDRGSADPARMPLGSWLIRQLIPIVRGITGYPWTATSAGPLPAPAVRPDCVVRTCMTSVSSSSTPAVSGVATYGALPSLDQLDTLKTKRGQQRRDLHVRRLRVPEGLPGRGSAGRSSNVSCADGRPSEADPDQCAASPATPRSLLSEQRAAPAGPASATRAGPNFLGDTNVVAGVTSFGDERQLRRDRRRATVPTGRTTSTGSTLPRLTHVPRPRRRRPGSGRGLVMSGAPVRRARG